ncbi:MAG: matrixin family metalloprotease [Clostridia bacterium]|nr:matrixin family metalloprotease [Deltaproteobacteria bacterium]
MRRLLLLAPVVLCGFTTTHSSSGTTSVTWASPTLTFTVDTDGVTAITDGSDITAVRNSFAAWNAVDCSRFRFVDGGLSSTATTFTVKFIHDESTWNGLGGGGGAVAYTKLTTSGGAWSSAIVYVSDFGGTAWGTDGNLRKHDLQSVITHELGHVLGLQHSADPQATMYYRSSDGVTYLRTLATDDVAGVCFLNPAGSASCLTDDDCPLVDRLYMGEPAQAYVCTSNACVAGTRSYGEDCFNDASCTDGASGACQRFDESPSANPGVCTTACPCSNGDVCSSGHCAPRAAGCVSSCGANRVCTQDIDGEFGCLSTCLTNSNCIEIAGAICFGAIDSTNAGVCRVPGSKANDVMCTEASQCASLICTVRANGDSVCVGTELVTPTERPVPMDPTETTIPIQPTEPTTPTSPAATDDPTSTTLSGGCTAVRPTQIGTILALVFVFMRVSWRKRSSAVNVASSSHDEVKRYIVR